MTEKPKFKSAKAGTASKIGRNARTGQFVVVGNAQKMAQSTKVIERTGEPIPRKLKTLQAQPTDETIDVDQFAQDLLVSDKWIMEYLAR